MKGPALSTSTRFTRNAIAGSSNARPKCRLAAVHARPLCTTRSSNGLKDVYRLRNSIYIETRRSFHSSSPVSKNPYTVLGVQKDASGSDIKKAYFQLAKKYHPDTNKDPASKDRFQEIQSAYETLGDDQKRAAYDTYGEASQQPGFGESPFGGAGNPFAGGRTGGFSGFSSGGASMEDLFSSLFGGATSGGGRGGRMSSRGDDLEASISVSFMEGAKGTSKTINIMPVADCNTCTGSGLKPGTKRTECKACHGTGTQTFVLNSGFQMASTCMSCQGSGSTIPRGGECDDCGGVGKIKYRKQIKIDVPAGVEDGMTIRVPGEGDAPMTKKGSKGDLLVRVNVGSSDVFRRQGTHLYHDASIPLHTAVLGGRVRVPTLDGDVEVRVSPGTQPGEDCVLRGRGVDSISRKGSKGDLFISFSVEIPRSLTRSQRELMERYADDVEGRSSTPASAASSSSSGGGGATGSGDSQKSSRTPPPDEGRRDSGATGKQKQGPGEQQQPPPPQQAGTL
ncbi:hypothetical protein M408DRAFT_329113 [Serendipita vermifera MAFF 305830]|uniref:DnaJ homolog 1, mitochondrial n=1 Tax=Serendipita vermifera MAFF 305830 TaxID=933852 RepID=A0A0C3AX67_SERVB|nr:hypothetical protein M408DRAFT_329113 [Serendipita vermifera MAFF 305830]